MVLISPPARKSAVIHWEVPRVVTCGHSHSLDACYCAAHLRRCGFLTREVRDLSGRGATRAARHPRRERIDGGAGGCARSGRERGLRCGGRLDCGARADGRRRRDGRHPARRTLPREGRGRPHADRQALHGGQHRRRARHAHRDGGRTGVWHRRRPAALPEARSLAFPPAARGDDPVHPTPPAARLSAIVTRLAVALMCAALAVGCGKQRQSAPAVRAMQSCCQCPGIRSEAPADPATWRIAPECQNVSVGERECEALCKSLGRPGGAIQDGTCSPAAAGGNTCQ